MKTLLTTVALVAATATMSHADGVSCDTVATCQFIANSMFDQAQALSTENLALKDLNADLYDRLDAASADVNAMAGIQQVVTDHKARAGDNFAKDPVGFMTFAFSYIEGLQSQLGLR